MTGTNLDRCTAFALEASTVDEFTAWLYGTSDDDWAGDAELYLELLEVDYRNRYAVIEVRGLLRRTIEERAPAFINRALACKIARDLLAGAIDLHSGCNQLSWLYREGAAEVGAEWIYNEDELDNPWPADEALVAAIREDARALLEALG